MTLYRLEVTCPQCGGDVHHITGSRPAPTLNALSKAVVACTDCRIVLHLEARLTAPPVAAGRDRMADQLAAEYAAKDLVAVTSKRCAPGERPACGTERGYKWHRDHGEDTCTECKAANAARRRVEKQRNRARKAVA
jgi:hypothetical protein